HPEHIFTGEKSGDELARHYASADIFLFPSLTDTYGNVVLEAMASGLHVVAFNYAAAGSLIRTGENGTLAAWQDESDFIAQSQLLADSCSPSKNLRQQARISSESLGWDKISEQFITHLTLIMEAGADGTHQKSRLVPKV